MDETYSKVKQIFTEFIKNKGLRKTPERYKILEEIYKYEGHFTVDELFLLIKKNNYRVSRATLYNTLDLLIECDLIKKHQFNGKSFFYEKAFKSKQHDHLICEKCGKIIEFCDPRIHEIIDDISELYKFKIIKHELYFYGLCEDCQKNKSENF